MRPKSGRILFAYTTPIAVRISFGKGDQQTTEQAQDALRSLRRVVGLHGHTELHNAPAEDDNADCLDAGKDEIRKIVHDGQRVRYRLQTPRS